MPISISDAISKYELEVIVKPSFLKKSTTSSFNFLGYGVKIAILFIFSFFKALVEAVLGVVTSDSGLAFFILFLIES